MLLKPYQFAVFALILLVSACGGSGSDGSEAGLVNAAPQPDFAQKYVGSWLSTCNITAPPGQNMQPPDGMSEDERLVLVEIDSVRLKVKSVKSVYTNTFCSTHTSYTRGADIMSTAEIVGTRTTVSESFDLVVFSLDTGGTPTKALAQMRNSVLYITRSDLPDISLNEAGYPQTLDSTQTFTRWFN